MGDISLTEGYFVPSLPSEVARERDPRRERKLSRVPPPRKIYASEVRSSEVLLIVRMDADRPIASR